MTNRDRDSAARLLLQVAERLRIANEVSADPHLAAAACGKEAYAIKVLVAEYLAPRPRPPRGKR